jgi:hypothetical protein
VEHGYSSSSLERWHRRITLAHEFEIFLRLHLKTKKKNVLAFHFTWSISTDLYNSSQCPMLYVSYIFLSLWRHALFCCGLPSLSLILFQPHCSFFSFFHMPDMLDLGSLSIPYPPPAVLFPRYLPLLNEAYLINLLFSSASVIYHPIVWWVSVL